MTQTVTFPAGQTSQTIPVSTLDDSLPEELETFEVSLSSPVGNGLIFGLGVEDTATVSILDDECTKASQYLHSFP